MVKISYDVRSSVDHSGNSDVDVNVHINTESLAYMFACALYATGKVDEWQFDQMIQNYRSLMENQHSSQKSSVKAYIDNNPSTVKLLGPPKRLSR